MASECPRETLMYNGENRREIRGRKSSPRSGLLTNGWPRQTAWLIRPDVRLSPKSDARADIPESPLSATPLSRSLEFGVQTIAADDERTSAHVANDVGGSGSSGGTSSP
jgi:hypothetical protein